MRKVLVLLFLVCSAAVQGQTSTYSFTRWTDPYVSIQGQPGTISTSLLSKDDTTMTNIPIGFTFLYCSGSYTQLSACSNGWLSLNNSTVGTSSATLATSSANYDMASISAIGSGVGLIMPFWDDLSGSIGPPPGPVTTPSTCYYQTSGTSPNRVFTFQWGNNSNPWHSYLGSGDATFQVKLYETSGVIEFHYGISTYSMKTATIGICNSPSDYKTLPTESSTSALSSFTYLIDTTPALNTVMEWAPPCPTASIPPASTGPTDVCQASTITLANTVPGGTWLSSSVSVATVGSTDGVVTGMAGGVVNITYKVSPGCFSVKVVTVNPLPDTIGGGANACEGLTKTYTCVTTGGTWSSSDVSVGTISTTGVFGGVTSGTTTLSYTNSLGCSRTLDVTVNSMPVISGPHVACLHDTITLTSVVPGGTWSSSSTTMATVDVSGNVMGHALGSVIITYWAPSGCYDTIVLAVHEDCDDAVHGVTGAPAEMKVFPQPSGGEINVSIPLSATVELVISDMYGKTLVKRTLAVQKGIPVAVEEAKSLPPGNYAIKVSADENVLVSKITIVK